MHLLRTDERSLDEAAQAVDLAHSPADIVCLSFSDSDLSAFACAHDERRHASLRLASLSALKHSFSIDLYLDKVCARARFALVRLLGGKDYWRYGVDELSALARAKGFQLAIIPGDGMEDSRLDAASTVAIEDLRRLWAYFQQGGPKNLGQCLDFISARIGRGGQAAPARPVEAFGRFGDACFAAPAGGARALIVFYRSAYLAGDGAPVVALAQALRARGLGVDAVYVSSLKDGAVLAPLRALIDAGGFDVILNATAFSARVDASAGALDRADAPVLQVIFSGAGRAQWRQSGRGLSAADLAMNVVLPEIDGRIISRAVSFKAEGARDERLEFSALCHQPETSRVDFVADLAANWARLRKKPNAEKTVALILSDYPAKGGRTAYAVGLDTPQSALAIAETLALAGYDVGPLPTAPDLIAALSCGPLRATMTLADYRQALLTLPEAFVAGLDARWGDPATDPALIGSAFVFRFLRLGKLLVAVQPDRGRAPERKGDYHDQSLPPRHAYLAFYLWLRRQERIDALIHCGAHGTLEWLPGKAVALSDHCAPEIVLGPTPLVYPFIVNNPGEAAQAKRRTAAVIIGHLTPPLTQAGTYGASAEIEALFDEYAQAQSLDARRAKILGDLILDKARESGLLDECGASADADGLVRLDAWLCDLKDMRINDGLHVFGRAPQGAAREAAVADLETFARAAKQSDADECAPISALLDACARAEAAGLLGALAGRFVEPGPAGAPSRGRGDVLPTGRNLYSIDPRAVPTRTAWDIGQRTARDVLDRYLQDHGEWPRHIFLDLWGSAAMRTGGDDLAQAFALLGVRPLWDRGSNRVNGYEILPLARLGRPRVDVTLRISGLFRDVFPMQIALFDAAVQALAQRDEASEDNPLAGVEDTRRIFGAPPGAYGTGLGAHLAEGSWRARDELAQVYLDSGCYAYGVKAEGEAAPQAFRASVARAAAFVHVQDMAGQDVLDSDAFSEYEGGFAAAAAMLGATPSLYHADATASDKTTVRALSEEVARVMRARAANPRWIAGQMRHGHRGAAEIAETVDNLFAFAALSEAAPSRHFDALFDALCGDDDVRAFLENANPQAAKAIAEKFLEAARRGFWTSRRNSSVALLNEMRGRS